MRVRFLCLLLCAAAGPAAANYYKCVADGYKVRWDGQPCKSDEVETEYDSKTKQPVVKGPQKPVIGMTTAAVRALPLPWGSPDDVNRTVTARGQREQWVYRTGRWSAYLYFDDGVLTTIQD